jgi:hypothetical protein
MFSDHVCRVPGLKILENKNAVEQKKKESMEELRKNTEMLLRISSSARRKLSEAVKVDGILNRTHPG